jgi:2'-hydroxyisoflavone reductase
MARTVDILIIGGSRFLGRAAVESAYGRGHRVATFNRGSRPVPEFVESILGDRYGDLAPLRGRRFDAVIDVCGYTPGSVGAAAALLGQHAKHYVFVSSVSVYPWPIAPEITEDAATQGMPADADPEVDEVDAAYGARKALCEAAAEAAMPGRTTSVRAGMIVGPHDYMDRLTYWIERAAAGGRMIAPGAPDRPVQLIDVGDLGHFLVLLAESAPAGPLNATSPLGALTMGDLIAACCAAAQMPAEPVWIDDAELTLFGVDASIEELPYWIERHENGIFRIDTSEAIELGLATRPLAETIARTQAWIATRTDPVRDRGLDRVREQTMLAAR